MLARWLGLSLVIATISISVQQGCTDLKRSLTHWAYYPIRDMRQTIVIDPQRGDPLRDFQSAYITPDSLSVPESGQDVYFAEAPYEGMAFDKLESPVPADSLSIVRGDTLYHAICWPCHGKTMMGDGPVAAQFMPPPDLLAEATREPRRWLHVHATCGTVAW